MKLNQILIYKVYLLVINVIFYKHTVFNNIKYCYKIWFTKSYWTNYNIVDGLSWLSKAIIIIPGLIFGLQIWWLYFIALATSVALIWASERKLLPTMVGFNTLWVWISCMVLAKNLVT